MPKIDPEAELRKVYGSRLDLHRGLYDASNAHRKTHGKDCDVYPSRRSQAPLWPLLAALTGARRFLEIGCGLGYTAAVMASAGGGRGPVGPDRTNPAPAGLAGP